MKALIQKLVEATGPSGYEAEVRQIVEEEIHGLAETRVDALGNLIAVKGQGQPGGLKIMLSAHLDEIGLIASHIDAKGFVRFSTIGGVSRYYLPGGRVRFLNGVSGVIAYEDLDEAGSLPAFTQMYIDVGATSREDCPVRIGDVAAFDRPFSDLGRRLVSKAMDDRIGAAILIETLKRLGDSPHQLYFVFSVQEEVGLRGAMTAAYGVEPDLGIALDVTRSGDTPRGVKMAVGLGQGPAIKVRDSGMLADPRVVDWMVETSRANEIPYQLEVLEAGTTDARAIQLSRAGVPAGCISIPCRYIHAPSEMVDIEDVENCVRLLLALLSQPIDLQHSR